MGNPMANGMDVARGISSCLAPQGEELRDFVQSLLDFERQRINAIGDSPL